MGIQHPGFGSDAIADSGLATVKSLIRILVFSEFVID